MTRSLFLASKIIQSFYIPDSIIFILLVFFAKKEKTQRLSQVSLESIDQFGFNDDLSLQFGELLFLKFYEETCC